MKLTIAPKGKRYVMLPIGIGFTYSEKNGHLVLKGETAWHKINGFWLNTPRGCFWFQFRRIQ